MKNIRKTVESSCARLEASGRTLADLYRIIFDFGDNVMAERPSMKGKFVMTYREAEAHIQSTAASIYRKLGECGRFIGLLADNSPEWIILFWAILMSGNKPFLINLRQPSGAVTNALGTLDAICVISDRACAECRIPTYNMKEFLGTAEPCENVNLPPFADEFALSTSGTTLKEKICIYSGQEICAQVLNISSIQKINEDIVNSKYPAPRMLVFLPLYHIFGLEAMYLWYSFFGTTFVFLPEMTPETILHTARCYNVTHIFAVPLLWHAIERSVSRELSKKDDKTRKSFDAALSLSLKLQDLSPKFGKRFAKHIFRDVRRKLLPDSVSFCISGGSYIKPSAVRLLNGLGYHLCNGYGMTEIGITSVELAKKPRELELLSIGKPFPSVSYRISERGTLLVRGKSVCKHIIIDGEMMPTDEWFDTGDVARIDSVGRCHLEGRLSDIVFGDDGENLNPDHTEKAFTLTDAAAYCVLGNEDNTRLMLVVELSDDMTDEKKEKLLSEIEKCNMSLPDACRVREVHFTYDKISDGGAIKVSRAGLRRAISEKKVVFTELFDAHCEKTAADITELREELVKIFSDILGLPEEEITGDAHFMNDLGGTSLDYFTLISEIGNRFGITLDYESDSFAYSLNDLEKIIKEMTR